MNRRILSVLQSTMRNHTIRSNNRSIYLELRTSNIKTPFFNRTPKFLAMEVLAPSSLLAKPTAV